VTERRPTDRYHHGDLRNALVDAAIALAREGGPDAVALREVARRVRVSPSAAYHHFASHEAIVQAVKRRSMAILTGRMRAALAALPAGGTSAVAADSDPAARASARLRALGAAYLAFAADEPGLFRIAFGPRGSWPVPGGDEPDDREDDPFPLLSEALDDLLAAGVVPAARRPGLEYVAWAAVHGISVLCLDGPLAALDAASRDDMLTRVIDTTIRGL
jgi:AcrR family transcriptional regulator